MLLTMLKCKLHRATVTECDLNYEGSISIDANLIEACGLLINERVERRTICDLRYRRKKGLWRNWPQWRSRPQGVYGRQTHYLRLCGHEAG